MNTIKKLSLRFTGVKCKSDEVFVTVNRQYIKIKTKIFLGYFTLPTMVAGSMESIEKNTIEPGVVFFEEEDDTIYLVLSFFKKQYKSEVSKEYILFVFDKKNLSVTPAHPTTIYYDNNPPRVFKIDKERKKMFIER